jgi:hypothetical protein
MGALNVPALDTIAVEENRIVLLREKEQGMQYGRNDL